MKKQGKNILFVMIFLSLVAYNYLLLAASYTPCIERPTIAKPAYERPNFPKTEFAKPNYEKPAQQKPVVVKDQFERPKIEQPVYIKPKFQDCADIKATEAKRASGMILPPMTAQSGNKTENQTADSSKKIDNSPTKNNSSLYFYTPPQKQEVANMNTTAEEECCGANLTINKARFDEQSVVVLPRRVLVK